MTEPTKIPDVIYHYTTQDGLLGIYGTKKIWATNIFYLNDHEEFKHTIRLAQILMSQISSEPEYKDTSLHNTFMETISVSPAVGVFVTSFSEVGDLLSQWRGYCSNEAGYSLGFDYVTITSIAAANNMHLLKCIYGEDEQKQILKTIFTQILHKSTISNQESVNAIVHEIVMSLYCIAPSFKDKSFSEEREWRLVSNTLDFNNGATKFRKGKSTIIPYIEVELDVRAMNCAPVKEIIVGPTPDDILGTLAVENLLFTLGVPSKKVKPSNVPFRNW